MHNSSDVRFSYQEYYYLHLPTSDYDDCYINQHFIDSFTFRIIRLYNISEFYLHL